MKPLDARQLDQRITIEQRGTVEDGLGQKVEGDWAAIGSAIWAKAEPLRGREFFAASAAQSSAMVRFVIRYRTGITGAMRVVWRGEAYSLVADPINVDGANRWLELMCTGSTT